MKKLLYILLAFITFNSCTEHFDHQSVTLNLQVKYNKQFGMADCANIPVTLTHLYKNVSITRNTGTNGIAIFENLDPGYYYATSSFSISGVEAGELSGITYSDSLTFNTSKTLEILEPSSDTLFIVPAFKSDIIIREFYYSGSLSIYNNLYFADQYLEIFNNSNESQDISGIIIATHESSGSSINIWADIEDSVPVNLLWQIPVNTTNNILEPGKSVVIARDAINHKTDPNGNINSPVDLSKADFEFYMETEDNEDLDSPAENLTEIYTMYRGNDVTFYTRYGGGLLLLKPPSDDMDDYMENHRRKKYSSSGSSYKWVIFIHNSYVLDAIDVFEDENSFAKKRFPAELDAGFTYNNKSGSGTCISRRLVSDVDGRKIYMDTNNSTNDFLNHQVPNPGLNE